mgnify:CR=1 FL=1
MIAQENLVECLKVWMALLIMTTYFMFSDGGAGTELAPRLTKPFIFYPDSSLGVGPGDISVVNGRGQFDPFDPQLHPDVSFENGRLQVGGSKPVRISSKSWRYPVEIEPTVVVDGKGDRKLAYMVRYQGYDIDAGVSEQSELIISHDRPSMTVRDVGIFMSSQGRIRKDGR